MSNRLRMFGVCEKATTLCVGKVSFFSLKISASLIMLYQLKFCEVNQASSDLSFSISFFNQP